MLMLTPSGAAEYATARVKPYTPCLLVVSVVRQSESIEIVIFTCDIHIGPYRFRECQRGVFLYTRKPYLQVVSRRN